MVEKPLDPSHPSNVRTRVPNTHSGALIGAMNLKTQRGLCPLGLVPFIPISYNPFV